MNDLDLIIFQISREPLSIEKISKRIETEYKKRLAKKSIYTSMYRLEELGVM